MTAILKVDTIQDTAGNNIINESSDTITIGASGDTTNIVGTLQNNGAAVTSYSNSDALSLFSASGSAPVFAPRAWVNFNGDGTISVRASGNVSSVTDQGTGDYTVNFSTAMSDTNFSCVGSSGLSSSGNQTYLQLDKISFTEVGSAQVACRGETNNRHDSSLVCVGIFR